MTNYLNIVETWLSASDTDKQLVKDQICNIVPEWLDHELFCSQALNDTYVFYKDYHNFDNVNKCVVFNNAEQTFTLSDQAWMLHLPKATQIITVLSGTNKFGYPIDILFTKYCGLYVIVFKKEVVGSTTEGRSYVKNLEDFNKCMDHCKKTYTTFKQESEWSDILSYTFDFMEDIDRCDEWYKGGWKKLDELGINAYDEEDRALSVDKFIERLNGFITEAYGCDLCTVTGRGEDFLHCLECISWKYNNNGYNSITPQSYNLCFACHVCQSISKEHIKGHHLLKHDHPKIVEKYKMIVASMLEYNKFLLDKDNKEWAKGEPEREFEELRQTKCKEDLKLYLDNESTKLSQEDQDNIIRFAESRYGESALILYGNSDTLLNNISKIYEGKTLILNDDSAFEKWYTGDTDNIDDINSSSKVVNELTIAKNISLDCLVKHGLYKGDIGHILFTINEKITDFKIHNTATDDDTYHQAVYIEIP